MWRFLAGVGSALALVAAGMFLFRGDAAVENLPPPPVAGSVAGASQAGEALPDPPAAPDRTREQKRFDRYDKDRDGRVTREEYLASRRKAYAKLDTNGDGRLSFEEWSAKTSGKFAAADKGHDGALDRAEFATTAVKRKPAKRVDCPQPAPVGDDG